MARIQVAEILAGLLLVGSDDLKSRHHARAAVAVHDGNHPERFFIGRVSDQVVRAPT